jgi:hypothetical protein
MKPISLMKPMEAPERWWPEELGEQPNSQPAVRTKRATHFLAISNALRSIPAMAKSECNDTEDHRISGVQQHQSSIGRKVTFTGQKGEVDLATLKPA